MENKKLYEFVDSLKHKNIYVTQESFQQFENLFNQSYEQDIQKISSIILEDPLLSLKIMLEIEKIKKTHLHFEIDSIKKGILLLGMKHIFESVLNSSVCICSIYLKECLLRSKMASQFSYKLAILRRDINPEEIALSALMGDLGEILLWLYYEEIPLSVKTALENKKFSRNREAQFKIHGFYFNDLSILLVKEWNLPKPILNMMSSNADNRSMIAKTSINLSRHLLAKNGYSAIPDDIRLLKKLLIGVTYEDIFNFLELNNYLEKEKFQYIYNIFCY